MRYDYIQTNCIDGEANAFAYCECNGADPQCEKCGGTGHIFIPFLCAFMCGEAFDDELEVSIHQTTVHGAFPMTEQ
jgi:hypothetical protein